MKRTVLFFLLSLLGLSVRAQVIVSGNLFQGRMSEITATVLDSLSNEPLAFASVYVVPSRDTVITNFTLSDAEGKAKLEEVPYGSYVFRVEMMGYRPFVRERYFREEAVRLGTIRLQPDEQFLEAARITDVGNPIVVKKDTVEFNASSFRVGANAMLRDLLQRMPGMEIGEDGKVKFNGEAIDKLTVGGRTFFFDDQSAALNNLPASVVDKIRVIDRESESTRATGLEDGSREKVLDVALKKEYEQGWFGNLGMKGGATAVSRKEEDALRDDRGMLYNGNALVSAYTEKDQVTVIANAQNIDDSNMIFVSVDADGNYSYSNAGLSTAAQLGVNANTARIKDVETTVSVNYKYSDMDTGSRNARTTYQEDGGDLFSLSDRSGKRLTDSFNTNLEFRKEQGNVWFHLRPSFRFSRSDSYDSSASETSREGSFLNRSANEVRSRNRGSDAGMYGSLTFRRLLGKDNRSLRFGFSAEHNVNSGESDETSCLESAAGEDLRAMHYALGGRSSFLSGSLNYTEPLGDKWSLSATANLSWGRNGDVRDASDAAGRNDWYSSESRNIYVGQDYNLTAQYKFGANSWITLGGAVLGSLNENWSRSFGNESLTGADEWIWSVRPTVRFQYGEGKNRFNVSSSATRQRPSVSNMLPVLNISDPTQLTLGNVYLRPSTRAYFNAGWDRNDRARFSTLMLYLGGSVITDPTTFARWYDGTGVLHSVPVNARKPTTNASLSISCITPLDAKRNWTLTVSAYVPYASSVSYMPRTTLPGADKDRFDYADFMADFWGDADGDRFYGGLSGFSESRTRSLNPTANLYFKYNRDRLSLQFGGRTNWNIVRYSAQSDLDMNTLETSLSADGTYTTRHEFEINSSVSYVFFRGYAAGYGRPEWQWNAEVSKNLGPFNLSLKLHDILDQTRSLSHTVTTNYEEDSYRLVMGRYILFGLKWNFGKMNATHSRRAQNAAMEMAW